MLPRIGPVRAVIIVTGAVQPFMHGCTFILPFRLQLAFHVARLLVHTYLFTSSAELILTGGPRPSVHWRTPRPPFCPAPALSATGACRAPAPAPMLLAATSLCSRFHAWSDFVHTSSNMAPFSLSGLLDPCRDHAPAILVLFANLLLGLFIPVFLAYRLERHAKAMYVKDIRASLRAATTPSLDGEHHSSAPPPGEEPWDAADEAPHSLPHWTDVASLALLAVVAWEAAAGFHHLTTYLQRV
jgi:hypothetical protein